MEPLSKLIDEKKNLAAAWEVATVEERSTLLDYWVLEVLITVEPIPGMKRANNKTALCGCVPIPTCRGIWSSGISARPAQS